MNQHMASHVYKLTGQFADRPTHGQPTRGVVNLQTSQLVNGEFLK